MVGRFEPFPGKVPRCARDDEAGNEAGDQAAGNEAETRPPTAETLPYHRVSSTPATISTAPTPCSGRACSPSMTHAAPTATSGVTHM